jgi:CheY-like chemotaxis protein
LRLPEAHAVLLFQSVRELLINSAKYAGSGRASVTVRQGDRGLRIEVRDEERGFDTTRPGQQEAAALSSQFGLFSIRERMTSLGGRFDVTSAPGKGTTATLILPLADRSAILESTANGLPDKEPIGPPTSHAARMAPQAGRQRSDAIRVLLVDDHAMMRQGLRSVLEAYPDVHIVGEAKNGEEAIECVHREQPSLVVMDINMPRLNGIDATVRIKSAYPDMKVIGLSVNADAGHQEAMRQAGVDRLLTKEAAVNELYRAIQQILTGVSLPLCSSDDLRQLDPATDLYDTSTQA